MIFPFRKTVSFIIALTFIISSYLVSAQTKATDYNQSFTNSYYEQKVSIHKLPPQSDTDIVFLGNSITDIGEWSEIWQDLRIKNRGISSDITAGVLARLDQLLAGKPAKLFILIGINDISRNIPDSIILRNYKQIVSRTLTESPETKVYVQSILPTNSAFTQYKNHQHKMSHISALNKALKAMCDALNLEFVDLYSHFLNDQGQLDTTYTNDGLHLNGAGYMLWKELLEEKKYCCN